MIRPALFYFNSLALVSLISVANAATNLPRVQFNRDIRPIMSDTCFHCHGFDAKSRKAGLRLDRREDALQPTKHDLLPIVPGQPDDSEIIQRIMDVVDPMPPLEMHKQLTLEQKELFRRWVAEGGLCAADSPVSSRQKETKSDRCLYSRAPDGQKNHPSPSS